MSKLITYSKAAWLPLVCLVALLNIDASITSAQEIQWRQNLDQAKVEARETNRLVWLHFSADWCLPCKKLDTFVFANTSVIRAADRNTVSVRVDADTNESLIKELGVPRIPYDIVMTPSGRVIVSRPSSKDSLTFLKMLNDLDTPLQNLNSGDRDAINFGLDQIQKVAGKTPEFNPNKSDLDLEGPSHEMAETTVQGQRLARGLESSERAAKIRAIEADLLKQKAKLFIAEEEKRLNKGQGPKITDNPFFKDTNKGTQDTQATALLATEANRDLSSYEEHQEFSFSKNTTTKASDTTLGLAAPKMTLPNFAAPKFPEQKQSLPESPVFSEGSNKKSAANELAYPPIDELRKTLKIETQRVLAAAEPKAPKASEPSLSVPKKPANEFQFPPKPKQPIAKSKPPTMRTTVSVPKPPELIEGEFKTVEKKKTPALQTRLAAAEQPLNQRSMVRNDRHPVLTEPQASRTDRLLKDVDFFATKAPVQQAAPRPVTVQDQPQPQIVINLNTNSPSQPAGTANQGPVIQPNAVAQASATNVANNRANVQTANAASAVGSKFGLKGKCPVTLVTQGQWVDGKREIGCVHRDRVYLFTSIENRDTFLLKPDHFSPLLAGFDPVIFEETGKLIQGEEQFGTFMGKTPNQRIVLFKTSDTRDRFQKAPSQYLDVVRRAMTTSSPKDTKLR